MNKELSKDIEQGGHCLNINSFYEGICSKTYDIIQNIIYEGLEKDNHIKRRLLIKFGILKNYDDTLQILSSKQLPKLKKIQNSLLRWFDYGNGETKTTVHLNPPPIFINKNFKISSFNSNFESHITDLYNIENYPVLNYILQYYYIIVINKKYINKFNQDSLIYICKENCEAINLTDVENELINELNINIQVENTTSITDFLKIYYTEEKQTYEIGAFLNGSTGNGSYKSILENYDEYLNHDNYILFAYPKHLYTKIKPKTDNSNKLKFKRIQNIDERFDVLHKEENVYYIKHN